MIAALGACSAPTSQEIDVPQVTTEVEAAVASLFEAMSAGDGDAVMAHYIGEGNFLYAGVTRVATDWEAWSGQVKMWYRANAEVTFEHQLLSLQVLAPTVAVTAIQGSSTEAEFLLWTQTWVKDDATGRWLVAAEHESWPECVDPPRAHPGTTG
jgi:ketosteroid isomerase-like protein